MRYSFLSHLLIWERDDCRKTENYWLDTLWNESVNIIFSTRFKLTWCAPDDLEASDGISHSWFQYSFVAKDEITFYYNSVTKETFCVVKNWNWTSRTTLGAWFGRTFLFHVSCSSTLRRSSRLKPFHWCSASATPSCHRQISEKHIFLHATRQRDS